MTDHKPLHTFKCGPCGTVVTALYTLEALKQIMELHAEHCQGFPPCEQGAQKGGAG